MSNPTGTVPPSYRESLETTPGSSSEVPASEPVVVVTQRTTPLGAQPVHTICPNCHAQVVTTTEKQAGTKAFLAGTLIGLLGCLWGCCLIPCFMDDCLDTQHTCPNCDVFLGKHK